MLPNYVTKMTDIPPGAEDKNRYANVIPGLSLGNTINTHNQINNEYTCLSGHPSSHSKIYRYCNLNAQSV